MSVLFRVSRAATFSCANYCPMSRCFTLVGTPSRDGYQTGLLLKYPDTIFSASSLDGISLRRSRLAVLATCSSAGGTQYGMEDTASLTHALLTAGVSNVVATLWDVDSQASRVMMLQFYDLLTQSSTVPMAIQCRAVKGTGRSSDETSIFLVGRTGLHPVITFNAKGETHMEVTKGTLTNSAPTKALPAKHFAILFEGAWLFTPDPKCPTRILAICPLIDNDCYVHECKFGIWNGSQIAPLHDMDICMPQQSHYRVEVDRNFEQSTYETFGKLFTQAAHTYPFVYLPQRQPELPAQFESMRSVSIPMPTGLIAEGALATAEIGGLGIGEVFEPAADVKRPFVTFLFIYEYCGRCASATVYAQEHRACIDADDEHPKPHLIFNVHPSQKNGMRNMDTAGDMVHTVFTFETLRNSVSKNIKSNAETGWASAGLCNIGLFHGRGKQKFLRGDSGLTTAELGIDPQPRHNTDLVDPALVDTDLASCAGGGMAAG